MKKAFFILTMLTAIVIMAINITVTDGLSEGTNPQEEAWISSPVEDFVFNVLSDGTCEIARYKGSETTVVIPQKDADGRPVTIIGADAFHSMDKYYLEFQMVERIVIPDGVTSIGERAFFDCSNLRSIDIPDSVKYIEDWAFFGNNLWDITLPKNLTTIGKRAFSQSSHLMSVTIPSNVTSIGEEAFYDCRYMESITLPDYVSYLGKNALDRYIFVCLKKGTITETTVRNAGYTEIEYIVDDSNNSLMEDFVISNGSITKYLGTGGDVVIPSADGVGNPITAIGAKAFYECVELTSIVIPNSITNIGDYAFCCCTLLSSVTVSNILTNIGDYAFYHCDNLFSVTLPNGVISIGNYAFSVCGLDTINIPNSVTSIGAQAFSYCLLTDVTIPNSVSSIGENAFAHCIGLTIYGESDSYAEKYAKDNQIKFITIGIEITYLSGDQDQVWPILPKSYQITCKWSLNAIPHENAGYNVYLVDFTGAEKKRMKLHSGTLQAEEIAFSSTQLEKYYKENNEILVYIKIEYIDLTTQEVIYSALSDYRVINKYEGQDEYRLKMLNLAYQRAVMWHDIIYRGEYSVGDTTYKSAVDKVEYYIAQIYKGYTGDIMDMYLDPGNRGILMAFSIMNQCSAKSATIDEELINHIFNTLDLGLDISKNTMKKIKNLHKSIVVTSEELSPDLKAMLLNTLTSDDYNGPHVKTTSKK